MPDSKPTKAVKAWLKKLEKSLAEKDTDKAVKLFGKDSYWRDLVSLTWNIKTVEGRDAIADMLNKTLASANVLRHGYETALCACYAAILIPMAAWVSRPFCSARI